MDFNSNQSEIIFQEIAKENDLKLRCFYKNLVHCFSKGKKKYYIYGFYHNNNLSSVTEICKDKQALSEILTKSNIACVEHKIFYCHDKHPMLPYENNLEKAIEFAKKYNYFVVCKTPFGAGGDNISFVENKKQFQQVLIRFLSKHLGICISPFFPSRYEYRVYILNKNVELIYKKILPHVIGDGEKTISELFLDAKHSILDPKAFLRNLNCNFLFNDKILKKEEIYFLKQQHNLSRGAKVDLNIESNQKKQLEKLAKKTANLIDLTFGSIDILENEKKEKKILEINPGITFEYFLKQSNEKARELVKKVYEKAILNHFKK